VTENPHDRGADLYTWKTTPPTFRTRPCTGPRFGEVVAVDGGHATTATGADTAALACHRRADEYLGILPRVAFDPNTAGPTPPREASFRPAADVLVALAGPDTRQRAADQAWTACVVYLPVSTDAQAPVTVDHALRGAWSRAGDSRLFALCLDDTASLVGANCRWPHRFEMMGMQWGNPKISQDAWDAACRRAAAGALGSSAALDRGELTTQVVAARPDPDRRGTMITGPDAVTAAGDYLNHCLVTPADSGRRLTAPLRDLGDAPAPLN